MEFQGTGRYDLMCMKTQELVRKENRGIQKHCNRRLAREYNSRSETIWDNYITQHYGRANGTEILGVEPEEEVQADQRHSEVGRAIKEMRDKKITRILRFLVKDGLKIMTHLVNNV